MEILEEKIRVGISACHYGAKVRWNGHGWDTVQQLGREKDAFIWMPVCPEVNAGFGVHRPTIKLSGGNGDDVWAGKAKVKNRYGRDVTQELKDGVNMSMEILKHANVEAFVFMEGSPTCGVYRTTLKNKRLGKPPGVFGSKLLDEAYFLIPALDLQSPVKWWDWRRRLHAFAWLKRKEINSKKDLYDTWHLLKFLCQEIDRPLSDDIGKALANAPKKLTKEFIHNWKTEVLYLLRRPSTLKRIYGFMQKHWAFYKKHVDENLPEFEEVFYDTLGKHKIVEQLQHLEVECFKQGVEFGGVPVMYRDKR